MNSYICSALAAMARPGWNQRTQLQHGDGGDDRQRVVAVLLHLPAPRPRLPDHPAAAVQPAAARAGETTLPL